MIIYEVNLKVQAEIKDSYLKWLNAHLEDMLKIDGFESAEIFRLEEKETEFIVQYKVKDQRSLDSYFENGAQEMRRLGTELFGNKFEAWRRILYKVN